MLHDLRYFKAAAHAQSFRQAAQALLITQPALTQAIRRLEAHTGHTLFERRRSGVKLTGAGARMLALAEPILTQWDALGRTLTDADERVEGIVSIGCHAAVARYSLGTFLPTLLKAHPALDVRLTHDLSRVIADRVNGGQLDIGIVVNPFAYPDVVIRTLSKDEVTFWKKPGAVADTLICDPALVQTQWLLRAMKKRFSRIIESSNLEVIRALGEAGAGTVVLPARVAKGGPLTPVRLAAPYVDRICLMHRPTFTKTRLGRTVADAIYTGMRR